MAFGFLYQLTFPYYVNPPDRYQEISDSLKEWFESNEINWGMGALGGSRVVYGDVRGPSEAYLKNVREQLAGWLPRLPVRCSVLLGPTKPVDALNLLDTDSELAFEIDNLTQQDRIEADEFHAARRKQAEER